jgi:hypothetical protein
MLRIRDINDHTKFFKLPTSKVGNFVPGMIAQRFIKDGKEFCCTSNGLAPCGIIDDIRIQSVPFMDINEYIDTTFGYNEIYVWNCNGIYTLDTFEKNVDYPENAPLYCSSNSLLTTKRESDLFPQVGRVIKKEEKSLTLNWFEQPLRYLTPVL